MNMRVTRGQVSANGGSNTPDPIQVLKDQLKAKLEAAVSTKDSNVKSLDEGVVSPGEFKGVVEEAAILLASARQAAPEDSALKELTPEKLIAATLRENPSYAEALSAKAAQDAARLLNTSDVFEAESSGAQVLSGAILQVPLDLNQDGKLEDGVDKVLNFKSAGPLHTEALANADKIEHWYGTQKGDSVLVAGTASQIAAAEAAQRKADEAKAKADAEAAFNARFETMKTTFWADQSTWEPLLGTFGFQNYVRELEPRNESFKTKLDVLLPEIFKQEDLVSQWDMVKASGVCVGRTESTPPTQYVGEGANRYGMKELYGRMFFRVSPGNTLPEGLKNGMTVEAYNAAIAPKN